MAATRILLLFAMVAASSLISPSSAQCSGLTFSENRVFGLCSSLSRLGSSIHWNYHQSNGTVDLAFRANLSPPGWIAWGINPTGQRMSGTQALVAVATSSGNVTPYTSRIEGYTPAMTNESLSFAVSRISATNSGGVFTIYATISLPNNSTTVNHVWQTSALLNGNVPAGHETSGDHVLSVGSLNFLSGESAAGSNTLRPKNVHGILNAISWGVLMPLGVVIARYVRVFESADPAWFYLHVGCQCSAYVLGVAGWGTGLKLGSDSAGITHLKHRIIGIVLFCLATLQVFALFLRPDKAHKKRIYWNVYHHTVGYCVIILSIINIFEGFSILNPERSWRTIYIAVIAAIGGAAVFLEVITWVIVIKRRRRAEEGKRINGSA